MDETEARRRIARHLSGEFDWWPGEHQVLPDALRERVGAVIQAVEKSGYWAGASLYSRGEGRRDDDVVLVVIRDESPDPRGWWWQEQYINIELVQDTAFDLPAWMVTLLDETREALLSEK